MRQIYFIDQTSLTEKDFIFALEMIVSKEKDLEIIFDASIHNTLKRYEALDDEKYFYLKTIYKYLIDSKLGKEIKSDDFCSEKALTKEISKCKGELHVVSQKNSTFNTFLNCCKDKEIELLAVEREQFRKKKIGEKVAVDPFFVAKDIYINKIDTDELDYVYSPKYGYLKLFNTHVNAGGEGTCYPSYKNLYCKIFNEKHLTYVNLKKLQHMLSLNIENEFLAWPKDILYYNGDFVGYAMNYVKGADSITVLRDDGFMKFGKGGEGFLNRAKICLSFLKIVKYLHDRNILICDLKADNVLVKGCDEVYIIDCGSFQVDDFPCDVVTKGWTDKEYHGSDLSRQLRTMDEEYFPINRLIFELMMLKNPFYSPSHPEDDGENNNFEFPLDVDNIPKPAPPHIMYWMALSPRIREYFYYFFKNPENRKITYIEEWIQEFEMFINALTN